MKNMNSFERYTIHIGMISILIFLILVILMALDGGELLQPIMLITLSLSLMVFTFLMALFSGMLAKPVILNLEVREPQKFLMEVSIFVKKKWGRKVMIQDENGVYWYKFGNRYADWLVSPMGIEVNGNQCKVIIPRTYQDVILQLSMQS